MSARTETISRICKLWRDGHTPAEIAQITGDRVGIVRTIVERERNAGRLTRTKSLAVPLPAYIKKRLNAASRKAGVRPETYAARALAEILGASA